MKKEFILMIVMGMMIGVAFAAPESPLGLPTPALTGNDVGAPKAPALTGNNGDAGDPNTNAFATVATDTAVTALPADAAVAGASSAATETSQPAQISKNSLGNTSNGRAAFVKVVRNLMPLDPSQIVTLRNMFDQSQRAVSLYPGVPPKPTSSSILVNMSPGATPPVIRLRAGYVTSLVFLDSTGQPWPVVGYDLGNPKAFNIQPNTPDGKSDALIVQALDRYEQGNLAVMLKDENTPVMITLIPGQRAVDYRVDLRIPGLGPNAVVSMAGLPQTESPILMTFLDGTTPTGAKLLTIDGAPAQCWLYQGNLFLRTRVTVLSPGWIASMSSPDGTHVYELAKTPVILASQRGALLQLSIKGL
ncbi:MAG: type IV secretion protein IcmK [Gammaproteobacteria bacterium]|nr:type IV secretion protein IcmK [Gammaproteobacteria bacterium]